VVQICSTVKSLYYDTEESYPKNCLTGQKPSLDTPSRRIRLKARVDLDDQTAEFMPFEVISNKHGHFNIFLPTIGYKYTHFC